MATDANRRAAQRAGLKYVVDSEPGIRRVRISRGFAYVGTNGRRITNERVLSRIRSLVIPPAWIDVWICSDARGHLQAVGRDARGRKQYRYHPDWRIARDESKYDKVIDFAIALPRIRRSVHRELARHGLHRDKVLAAVIAVMEQTFIRVGNDEYATQNGSFGLTTLRDRHAAVNGKKVRFLFDGKSGVEHDIDLEDPRLAQIIRKCRDLPGQELFQYLDENGEVRDITSSDVNEYLRRVSSGDFTAKDFRTWAGTVLAARALSESERVDSKAGMKKNIVAAIETVAKRLGNTRAVCRKCYVHPAIIGAYLDGTLLRHLSRRAGRILKSTSNRLSAEETAVLKMLRSMMSRGAESRRQVPN